ncbi:hypothetical protein EV643_12579 [Kribbella sp. VKM Ac-2527]|uniref:Uncharacterized protein n=1 Tax=Kribbella caucasensis TaxID=2512215 RepID=A0A4R6JGK7_9ACTN|nr:hypothetical protein [Kribbella sp. VKM Ac-2527]TDO34822.1 hypothetical protein EV643_12579 [Kribbella sp. VKM Ac-2527]
MQMRRMNREQFFGKLATLDEDRLAKVLWNLYWRGSAPMRARIEAAIDPDQHDRGKDASIASVDPEGVLAEVRDFVSLARSGAHLGGDRRVSPKERTRWRFTFRRLVTEAQDALRTDESDAAAAAVAELIDLACATREYDYFRSEDPVEAARFVVSDAAALLWNAVRDRHGLSIFAQRSAPQLIRWASRHGWTRSGWGPLSEKETSLAGVLAGMLRTPEMWIEFADRYLDALDDAAHAPARQQNTWRRKGWDQEQRTAALADWHLLLLDKLTDYEADDQLTSLATHPALAGPELTHLQARLAHRRGETSRARELVHDCLQKLPGHQQFLDFAAEIGARLPPHAQEISNQRQSTQASTS